MQMTPNQSLQLTPVCGAAELERSGARSPERAGKFNSRRLKVPGLPIPYRGLKAVSRTIKFCPAATCEPSWQNTCNTFPAQGAATGNSVFLDSTITSASPAETRSPGFTGTFHTLPASCVAMARPFGARSSSDSGIVHGSFPPRALRHVLEWTVLHKQE